jgi:hypothetical protein
MSEPYAPDHAKPPDDHDSQSVTNSGPAAILREHLALAITVVTPLIVVIRLLAVSGFDNYTALAVLSAQGSANVLVGSLLPIGILIPQTVFVVAAAMIIRSLNEENDVAARQWFITAMVCGLLAVATSPWPDAIFWVFSSAFILYSYWGAPWRFTVWSAAFFLGIGLVFFLGSPRPWLPTEAVATGKNVGLIGYVLKSDGEHLIILTDSPRGITRVATSNVQSRHYCERPISEDALDNWWRRQPSLLSYLSPETVRYPSCEELIKARAPKSIAP